MNQHQTIEQHNYGSKQVNILVTNDLHLDFYANTTYLRTIEQKKPDALFIAGDIGTYKTLQQNLTELSSICPVFFVLGNHDFYGGSFEMMPLKIAEIHQSCKSATHLTTKPRTISLRQNAVLFIGVDSWADHSTDLYCPVELTDFYAINEFIGLNYNSRVSLMRKRSCIGVEQFFGNLPDKLPKTVIIITHVPPFTTCARYKGGITAISNNYFASTYLGKAIVKKANENPDTLFHVYCGHTHTSQVEEYPILLNLLVTVLPGKYGSIFSTKIEL